MLGRLPTPTPTDLLGTLGSWLEVHRDISCTLQGPQGSQENGGLTQLWLVNPKVTVSADVGRGGQCVAGRILPTSIMVRVVVLCLP